MSALSFDLFPGFTAAQSLSLSTDGPIASAQWAEARAHDAAHPLPARARIGRITLKPPAIVAIIATALAKSALRGVCLTRDELRILGLSQAEIDRHFPEELKRALTLEPRLAQMLEAA